MARLGCLLGVLLIGVALVAMGALVVVPALGGSSYNDPLFALEQSILCQPGQTLDRQIEHYSDSRGSSANILMYCLTNEGQRIDANGKFFLMAGASFAVPFIIGLMLVIIASQFMARRRFTSFASGLTMNMMNPGGRARWNNMGYDSGAAPGSVGTFSSGTPGARPGLVINGDLSNQLQQIQDALSKGLISQVEYDAIRKRILGETN